MIDNDDPIVYCRREQPTPEESALARVADRHDGDAVPFWLWAAVATRLHRTMAWVAERAAIERRLRRAGRLGVGTLVANLAIVGGYAAHRLEAGGAAAEHAANVERQLIELREEVSYLRRRMDKMSGIEAMPPSSDTEQSDPDKLSLRSTEMDSLPAMMAPFAITPTSTCFNICGSDIECSHDDIGQRCQFCNFGHCSTVRPLDLMTDAGVDASDHN